MIWAWRRALQREGEPVYMVRYQLLRTRRLSIFVNHILTPDGDPRVHSHPWGRSYSLRLAGWYKEVVPVDLGALFARVTGRAAPDYMRGVLIPSPPAQPPRFHRIPQLHRIVEVAPGGAWTLFVAGRRRSDWGFLNTDGTIEQGKSPP